MQVAMILHSQDFKVNAYKMLRRVASFLRNQEYVWSLMGAMLRDLDDDMGTDLKNFFKTKLSWREDEQKLNRERR